MSSLSRATVFRVRGLTKHPNADSLLISEFEGCPYIVNMNDTKNGDLRIFLPFDLRVPDEDKFPEFVRGKRIRPMRLRGVFSMAAVIPIPEGIEASEGDDVTESLGFTKWEPEWVEDKDGVELQTTGSGRECSAPVGISLGKYDLESLRKYHKEFIDDEPVVITEKLEGENISIVYWEDKLHVKSRNRWIAEGDNEWWSAVRRYDWTWLESNPGLVAQGEKYGNVNKFRYDCPNGIEKIRLFDVYDSNKMVYLPWDEFNVLVKLNNALNVPLNKPEYPTEIVPLLYEGPWLGFDEHKSLAEGQSAIGNHLREGFVVQPLRERRTRKFERIKYKLAGEGYLIAKGKMK